MKLICNISLLLLLLVACNTKSTSNKNSLGNGVSYDKPLPKFCITETSSSNIKTSINLNTIDSLIQLKVDTEQFNGAVLIGKNNQIIYEKYVGYEDFASQKALTLNSKFQIASITKTFTSVAILQLIEKGYLKLSDTIQAYFPKFPYHGITIDNLLSHHSGLPKYEYVFDKIVKEKSLYPSNLEIINWFSSVLPLPEVNFPPNTNFNYNNLNYCILAAIIEKITQHSYSQYLQYHFFEPLCMSNSQVLDIKNPKNENTVKGYKTTTPIALDNFDGIVGDKGIYSTPRDLFKWYYAITHHSVLTSNYTNLALTPKGKGSDSFRSYGYGFRIRHFGNTEDYFCYHTGWWKGFNTIIWWNPKKDYCLIVLGNTSNKGVYKIMSLLETIENREIDGINEQNNEE